MKKTITVIIITNTKTNEEFRAIMDVAEVEKNGKTNKVYTLGREDGTTKEVAESTFKRYYKQSPKQVEIEVEDPKPMNTHQKTAAEQLENAYNCIVGGYYNTVQDGEAEEMPPVEDMFDEVMEEATTHLYGKGMCSQKPAPAAMNFAGKKFLIETLVALFEAEGFEVPNCCKKVPEKKQRAAGPRKNVKGDPESVGEDEVVMRAFTGMLIGVFKIVVKTAEYISVELANGTHMDFDINTGKELGARNPRFANRIEI
jgi:hypothetical protein